MLYDVLVKEKMNALKEKNANKRKVMENVTGKALLVRINKREKGQELTDEDVILVVNKVIKELEEELSAFETAGRSDIVNDIKEQIAIISEYKPKQLSSEEIKQIIENLPDKTLPSIMKYFKLNYAGKCDMGVVSNIARSLNQ